MPEAAYDLLIFGSLAGAIAYQMEINRAPLTWTLDQLQLQGETGMAERESELKSVWLVAGPSLSRYVLDLGRVVPPRAARNIQTLAQIQYEIIQSKQS